MPSLTDFLEVAKAAAQASAADLRNRAGATRVGAGLNMRDIKLEADRISEAQIVGSLRRDSDLPILSEEGGWHDDVRSAHGSPYWAVDPLDGSFNYFRGIPLCCTSVALCNGDTPLLGAIFDFNRGELFCGGPGLGFFINGQIFQSHAQGAEILATGFPVRSDQAAVATRIAGQVSQWKKLRMLGSAALSLAWLAAGRLDGYEETGIMWWDVAAGIALARAAGCTLEMSGGIPDAPCDVRAVRT